MSQVYTKYCDEKLAWYDREYNFIDLNRWKEFDKGKDVYISNVNVYSFSKIYKNFGFKPKAGPLKKTAQFSESKLQKIDEDIKKSKTIDEPLIN